MTGKCIQASRTRDGKKKQGKNFIWLDSPPFTNSTSTTSNEQNARLVRKIHSGDRTAEELLCQRFTAPVEHSLIRRGTNSAEAQDVAQETLLIVIKRLRERGLEQPDRLASYIFRTARNLSIAGLRRAYFARRCHTTDVYDVLDSQAPDQSDALQHDELKRTVSMLLDQLTQERDKQVLIQRYLLEIPKMQVCHNLFLTPTQFDRVLFNARKRFASIISSAAVPI